MKKKNPIAKPIWTPSYWSPIPFDAFIHLLRNFKLFGCGRDIDSLSDPIKTNKNNEATPRSIGSPQSAFLSLQGVISSPPPHRHPQRCFLHSKGSSLTMTHSHFSIVWYMAVIYMMTFTVTKGEESVNYLDVYAFLNPSRSASVWIIFFSSTQWTNQASIRNKKKFKNPFVLCLHRHWASERLWPYWSSSR